MLISVDEIEKKIAQYAPSQESPFARSIMGEDHVRARNRPFWTGWKTDAGSVAINRNDYDMVDAPSEPYGYVGQWVCFAGDKDSSIDVLTVNVPDMQKQVSTSGGTFDIGHDRVYADAPLEELERLIEAGYAAMVEFMKERGVATT